MCPSLYKHQPPHSDDCIPYIAAGCLTCTRFATTLQRVLNFMHLSPKTEFKLKTLGCKMRLRRPRYCPLLVGCRNEKPHLHQQLLLSFSPASLGSCWHLCRRPDRPLCTSSRRPQGCPPHPHGWNGTPNTSLRPGTTEDSRVNVDGLRQKQKSTSFPPHPSTFW